MKKIFKNSMLVMLISLLAVANSYAESSDLDEIVAVVNSDVITASELNREYVQVKKHLATQQTTIPDEKKLRDQVLNQLIDQSVELQTASKAGIEVTDDELDQAINDVAKRNEMTLDELQQKVQAEGLTFADYRLTIRKQMIIDKLLQHEVRPRVTVSKQEVDKYLHSYAFEQQHISEYLIEDILIRLPEIPSSEQLHNAHKQAKEIISQLQQGESFESLAIVYSKGDSALQGGSLGWRRIEEIPSVFSEHIKTMQKQDVAGPIRAANGLHIIKLLDTQGHVGRHYTQQTHVRHILLKPTARKTNEAMQAELKTMQQQINDNEKDFAALAEEFSEDRVSATKGGDLGWVSSDDMVPPFTLVMEQLPIGDISEPVKTQFGWHLVQVIERRDVEDTEKFQRRQIEKMLYERNFHEQTLSFIQRMRDVSYVNILLTEDDKAIPDPLG